MQNKCFLLSNMQICDVLVAVVVLVQFKTLMKLPCDRTPHVFLILVLQSFGALSNFVSHCFNLFVCFGFLRKGKLSILQTVLEQNRLQLVY